MGQTTDIDNRDKDAIIAFQEAQIETLKRRIQQLENENKNIRQVDPCGIVDSKSA